MQACSFQPFLLALLHLVSVLTLGLRLFGTVGTKGCVVSGFTWPTYLTLRYRNNGKIFVIDTRSPKGLRSEHVNIE